MKILLISTFLLIAGCANLKNSNGLTKEELSKIKVIKTQVFPGKVKFLEISLPGPDREVALDCDGRVKRVNLKSGVASFYLAESYFSERESFQCKLKDYPEVVLVEAKITPFPYKEERLRVNKRRVELNEVDLARVIKEKEIKKQIYQKSENKYLFTSHFIKPLNSYVTSVYGNRRLFNNKKRTQHLGTDLRAAVGVKIPTTNDGKVVFAGNLFFTGNVVVVDHGKEIFSLYGHLSKILVKQGDFVKRGDIIGEAGATGRVSGPHLHWGIKIDGHWVDGFSLVQESQKHFREPDGV
jgi:murein DD-endopeptidase MepM/ murein hydrolase activator NlpD